MVCALRCHPVLKIPCPQCCWFTKFLPPHDITHSLISASNTSAPVQTYEQLKARATAHRGAPTTPERSPSPVRLQGETNVELPPEQCLSSSSNSALHNNTDRTTAEFNSVVAVYNMMPNIVNNAQAFTQVRNSHLLPSCQLTLHPASTKQPTPPSFPCNPRDLINR